MLSKMVYWISALLPKLQWLYTEEEKELWNSYGNTKAKIMKCPGMARELQNKHQDKVFIGLHNKTPSSCGLIIKNNNY